MTIFAATAAIVGGGLMLAIGLTALARAEHERVRARGYWQAAHLAMREAWRANARNDE